MLLTITTTHQPATDLGYLLHKHPARLQQTEIKNGKAHIFYTVANEDICTCALLLDIDPVGLVRGNGGTSVNPFALEQYVNDRPYVASSLMSSAIVKSFGSALNGKCKDKPELVDTAIPLEVKLSVLPVSGGVEVLHRMFEPLGYSVSAVQHPLDSQFPDWGNSRYFTVTLNITTTLQTLLSQLFILIPVLDNDKHYWVNEEEVEKLLVKGKGWLESHPEMQLITRRYLRHQRALADDALTVLMKDDDVPEEVPPEKEEEKPKIRLHDARLQTVCEEILRSPAQSVIDLGCGEGKLLKLLLPHHQLVRITGMDVSLRSLEIASRKLKLDRLTELQRNRIQLIQGSLTYRDRRLEGFDIAALVEVIEHLDEDRLTALEKNVFAFAAPRKVIVTTPNKEWNSTFTPDTDKMRHSDHRFEWTRAEFGNWCDRISTTYGYACNVKPFGEETGEVGAPSQMAIFTKQ
jgi:3' terminal RNA ribose 2'-O-methyltransferase Hen1